MTMSIARTYVIFLDTASCRSLKRLPIPCSLECKEALAQPRAHAGSSRLSVHTAVSAAPVDLWSSGSSRALPTEEPQACSGGSSPVEQAQLADAVPHGDLERGLMAPTPPQKAQRRPRRSGSSGSPSEDNLSMTGLMDSGSEVASNKSISKVRASAHAQTSMPGSCLIAPLQRYDNLGRTRLFRWLGQAESRWFTTGEGCAFSEKGLSSHMS